MPDPITTAGSGFWLSLIQGSTAVPKAVAKLIDTVGEQFGLLLEPTHIRRKGQAEADVRIADAIADARIATIKVESKLAIQEIKDRAFVRVRRQEEARQRNLEAITTEAAGHLPEVVSDKPVDQDWLSLFLESSQHVSNEQMRTVWAKILAGEVAQPGRFSARTMATVRTLSTDAANLFTKFCSSLWVTNGGVGPILPQEIGDDNGIDVSFGDYLILAEFDLIHDRSDGIVLTFETPPPYEFFYFGRIFELERAQGRIRENNVPAGHITLTGVGAELAGIAGALPSAVYVEKIREYYEMKGWTLTEAKEQT